MDNKEDIKELKKMLNKFDSKEITLRAFKYLFNIFINHLDPEPSQSEIASWYGLNSSTIKRWIDDSNNFAPHSHMRRIILEEILYRIEIDSLSEKEMIENIINVLEDTRDKVAMIKDTCCYSSSALNFCDLSESYKELNKKITIANRLKKNYQ